MTLPLLSADPLEVVHLRGDNWRPDELQPVQLRLVAATLVVFDEHLDVLHVLELDVPQIHQLHPVQVLCVQTGRIDGQLVNWPGI